MPLCLGTSTSVRESNAWSANSVPLFHTFCPLKTHSSLSRTCASARSRDRAGAGLAEEFAPSTPRRTRHGIHRCFCSSSRRGTTSVHPSTGPPFGRTEHLLEPVRRRRQAASALSSTPEPLAGPRRKTHPLSASRRGPVAHGQAIVPVVVDPRPDRDEGRPHRARCPSRSSSTSSCLPALPGAAPGWICVRRFLADAAIHGSPAGSRTRRCWRNP